MPKRMWTYPALVVGLAAALAHSPAAAQASQSALRFYGTGAGQQDRVRIAIDDDAPGPDASAPCDVGSGSFTLDFWLRGNLADNATANGGGDREYASFNWIDGNTVVDRDIFGGSEADWGVSLAGGFVRFGTGRGEPATDPDNTIEGSVNVLDGQWHHVAVVRDVATGTKRIYVDGQLDFASSPGVSAGNISYPNGGVAGQVTPWGPYIVLAAEKHDAGSAYPSFDGYLDEFRVWNVVLTQSQLLDVLDRVIPPGVPGLVAYYRFEEGSGTSVADSSAAGSPAGELIAGVPGNGEWAAFAASPANTAPVSSGPLPAGFARTTVASGLEEPTVLEFTPDGRLFVGERGGRIRILQGALLLPEPLIEIPASTLNGERGLLGLARDPEFATNGWLYVYYTTPEPRNRVSRFTVVGNTAALASEFVVWQNPALAADYHNGGAIAFGPDGNLYIATGDQFDSSTSQNLGNQHGKILRLAPDGSIPASNPFVGVPGAEAEIWAYGLRNPFRLTFDPQDGGLWIGDVGGNSADSWEEVERGLVGANYGWPLQEGPTCYAPPCVGITFPDFSYQHNDPDYYLGQPQASITTGPVYRATAFPPAYRGSLYFGDYANRFIRRLVFGANGSVVGDPLFLRSPEAGTIVDLEVGPDGGLYYVTIGVPWSGTPDAGAVHRIAYAAGGNQPPIAVAGANVTQGPAPLAVQFSSAGSYDPDSGPGPVAYSWDFGDGNGSTQPNPQHVYAANGPYTARLALNDGLAASAPDEVQIVVGAAPAVMIVAPAPGTTYRAGDSIQFSGTANDPDGPPPEVAGYSWQVVLVHAQHAHPFLGPIDGVTQGQFTIPTTGHPPANTYFEIGLEVTDADGLSGAATRAIVPVVSPLTFDTAPSGISLLLDGAPLPTPAAYSSLVGYQHEVEAPASFLLGGAFYAFRCWSDGGARAHFYQAPEGGGGLIATFAAAPAQQVVATVASIDRDADSHPAFGEEELANFYDPMGLCVGRESDGSTWQVGLQFALDVPQGATITGAVLRVVATSDNAGDPVAEVRAYDVASAAPFANRHSHPIAGHHPTSQVSVSWNLPPISEGQAYDSPALASVVQAVVSRPDWVAGNVIGLVLDGSASAVGNHWRCVRKSNTSDAARLTVTWSVSPPASAGPPGPVTGLVIGPARSDLSWAAAAGAATHDLLRGTLSSPWTFDHACLISDLAAPQASDAELPPPGTGFYYLARGANACGLGTAGSGRSGTQRPNPVCP